MFILIAFFFKYCALLGLTKEPATFQNLIRDYLTYTWQPVGLIDVFPGLETVSLSLSSADEKCQQYEL
jgi:hypothetical protein